MSDEQKKKDKQKRIEKKIVTENHLDFLLTMHEKGVELKPEDLALLQKHNKVELPVPRKIHTFKKPTLADTSIKSETQRKADKFVDIIDDETGEIGKQLKDSDDLIAFEKLMDQALFTYKGGKEITKADWMPKDILKHSKDFIVWINSILSGFQNMTKYKPFQMYCQQASDWLAENDTIINYTNRSDKKDFARREFRRCRDNSLYAMDKYLMLKEGDLTSGSMKYTSKPVHKLMCFLVDCGYSLMIGKGRQIAATSTLAGIATFKIMFNKNYFIKMIAQDKDKVIEIFEDKIKYPFSEFPAWMQPSVSNDRDNLFRLGKKTKKKGTKGGVGSKIQVVAPTVAAINGGSPPLVMIDEAGYIGILSKMMKEARPTMFMQDPETGLLKMKRQIIIWGTGGEMDKGGKAYESEFFSTLKKWKDGQYSNGIIPLFFDWTCRPGMTKDMYDQEKINYTVEGPEKEVMKVQFRQHYPSIIEDMFLTSEKTLVGIDWINQNLEKIHNLEHKHRAVRGYFEPIYDNTEKAPEHSDVPYKIVGATFIPVDDVEDKRASCTIFMAPEKNWKFRYFQGTDPVMSDDGLSNMASGIFDAHHKTISAIVDYRDPDHKYTFLQTMLLGLYYGAEPMKSVKELVESNIGTAYIDYKEAKGFRDSFVYRTELPDHMSGGNSLIGIDNRGARKQFIVNKLHELLTAYGDRFYIDTIFIQLRTFVCTVTEKGNITWGVKDKRKYHDDVLDAITFAYICSLCYIDRPPKKIESDSDKYRIEWRLTRVNGQLSRKRVKVKISDEYLKQAA